MNRLAVAILLGVLIAAAAMPNLRRYGVGDAPGVAYVADRWAGTVVGASYKFFFVPYLSSDPPAGVAEHFNLGVVIKKQKKNLADVDRKLAEIEDSLSEIANALQPQ